MTTSVAFSSAVAVLEEICAMEELKKATVVTSSVLTTARTLLQLKDDSSKLKSLSELTRELEKKYSESLKKVKSYKLAATKRDKLWRFFHQFSLNEGYTACKKCDKAMELNAHEMFWQLFLEKGFLREVNKALKPSLASDTACASRPREVSDVEENAIRYIAGYVIRKLEVKYAKQKTESGMECTTALKEMAGQLHTRQKITEHHSANWTCLVDRGGLYHVEDIVYYLFVALELIADKELSTILERKGKDIEKIGKGKLQWLCEDEEIQFIWCLISPLTIQEESVRQNLLRDIVHLWVTTRIHSKLKQLKEEWKKSKAEAIKGKKALRKQLKTVEKKSCDE